jgi:hypothetical protein
MSDEYEAQRRRVRERMEADADIPAEEYTVELGPERGFMPGSYVDLRSGFVFATTMSDAEVRQFLSGSPDDPWPYDTVEEKRAAVARAKADRGYEAWKRERGLE